MSEINRHIANGLLNEISFRASRSSGPGGQGVNKVNSRVELFFDVDSSTILSLEEKEKIRNKLAKRINSNGELYLSCQVHRSQLMNKQECIDKFIATLTDALKVSKKRKNTSATLSSKLKRLEIKRHRSEKKKLRQKPSLH